jgi:pyridoxine kinase
MMLTGYAPSAAGVEAIGAIAQELKLKAAMKPGSFFWVLDPVMGDNGKLYVAEDVVPAYASLVPHADLILPNQYEAECARLFRLLGAQSADMSYTDGYLGSRLQICKL